MSKRITRVASLPDEKGRQTGVASNRVTHLSQVRDGFVVAAGGLYLLGYTAWSMNAWEKKLGLLPALPSQYLIAGIPPAMILAVACLIGMASSRMVWRLIIWSALHPRRAKWLVAPMGVVAALGGIGAIYRNHHSLIATPVWHSYSPGTRMHDLATFAIAWLSVVLGSLVIGLDLKPSPEEVEQLSRNRDPRRLTSRSYLVLTSLLLCLPVGQWLYYSAVHIYPAIPQELGGVRPRHASFDLERGKLSQGTLERLLDPASPMAYGEVVQTNKLDVMFAGSDTLLVRPTGSREVFELNKEIIKAIRWWD